MKNKFILLITFVPLILFIVLFQIDADIRKWVYSVILCLAVITFTSDNVSSETFIKVKKQLSFGMLLLSFFICTIAVFHTEGILSANFMETHYAGKADAILVLASGSTPAGLPGYAGFQRITHGIELLRQGRAPKLIISTGYSPIYEFSEYNWVASYTSLFDVDHSKIEIWKDESILTTYKEAQYLKKHDPEIKTILLVTSGAHILRAKMTFNKAGVTAYPAPVHNKDTVTYAAGGALKGFHAAVHEWIGLLYYRLRGRL